MEVFLLTPQQVSFSQTAIRKGIDNTIPEALMPNAITLSKHVVEPLKKEFKDVHVSSWYRCEKLNKMIGGAPNSQHTEGKAVDLVSTDNEKLFHYIKDNLEYDQIIWEFGTDKPAWVHVSFNEGHNRKQALKAVKLKTKTIYRPWIY